MNINELADNNTNPIKENQKEVIENLDNTALKIKAENKLEELDKKSKELIEILEKFSKKVPPMINRLDTINEGLKLEPMEKTLVSIKTNSDNILKAGNEIIKYNKDILQRNQNTYEAQIRTLGETARKNINKREYFYYLLDKTLILVFLTMIFLNIGTIYFYKKNIEKTNSEITGIHNILIGQKKYWLNEDNHKIYIKQAEIKK